MSNPLALIIEDDPDLNNIFGQALQVAGFDTEIIADGQTATKRLGETIPAVVVLDLHLPHVSGRDILEQIRGDSRLDHTKVILATADPLMAESLQDEADLVLLKPISFGQLRDLAKRFHPY